MSPIPQLPVATAPAPQSAKTGRTEAREGAAGTAKTEASFASVLSNAVPEENAGSVPVLQKPETELDPSEGNEQPIAEEETAKAAPVVDLAIGKTDAKLARPGFLAQLESAVVISNLPVAAANEEGVDVAVRDEPLATASPAQNEKQALVPLELDVLASESEVVQVAETSPRETKALVPETVHSEHEGPSRRPSELAHQADGVGLQKVPVESPVRTEILAPVETANAVIEPRVALTNVGEQPAGISSAASAESTTAPQPIRPQPVEPSARPVAPAEITSEGRPAIEAKGEPVVQVVTRLDARPVALEADEATFALTNRAVGKRPAAPAVAETAVARQVAATVAGDVSPTVQVRADEVVVAKHSRPRVEPKGETASKPVAEHQSLTLGTQGDPEPENGSESQARPKQQPKAAVAPNVAAPSVAMEGSSSQPSHTKPPVSRPTVVAMPAATSVPVQAVADVASRPTVMMSQPVADVTPPSVPLTEDPALNAQLQQQASRTTLNVVMHDDRLGRVALQLIERGGWVETAIRTSDPRGAQALSNATAGLIDALQQRGVTAMAAGGSAAWEAQEGQRRDNPHRNQDPQRRRLRVRQKGQGFIGALAQVAS